MTDRNRCTNIYGVGTFGLNFGSRLRPECDKMGATSRILTQQCLEFNLQTFTTDTDFGRDGVKDFSPRVKDISLAMGFANDPDLATKVRDIWYPVTRRMVDQVIQTHLQNQIHDGMGLWLQGFRTGHGQPAEVMLRDLKERWAKQLIVMLSTLPADEHQRDNLREGYDLFLGFKEQGLIECLILMDNRGPFSLHFTNELQDASSVKAIASLLSAQAQFPTNRSFVEIGRALGEYAAFVGMSCASRNLVPKKEVGAWKALRGAASKFTNATLPERGIADIGHTIEEAIRGTEMALKQPQYRLIDEEPDFSKLMFIIYTIPMGVDQPGWVQFSNQIRKWLANNIPKAVPIFTSGIGTPQPNMMASYWLQVSALYPIPDVPAPIASVIRSVSHKRKKGGVKKAVAPSIATSYNGVNHAIKQGV